MNQKDNIGKPETYQRWNKDKQGVAIETKQLNKARWNWEVFQNYIQSKRYNYDIAVEHSGRPSYQIYVIVPIFVVELVCYIGHKSANRSCYEYQGSAYPKWSVPALNLRSKLHNIISSIIWAAGQKSYWAALTPITTVFFQILFLHILSDWTSKWKHTPLQYQKSSHRRLSKKLYLKTST